MIQASQAISSASLSVRGLLKGGMSSQPLIVPLGSSRLTRRRCLWLLSVTGSTGSVELVATDVFADAVLPTFSFSIPSYVSLMPALDIRCYFDVLGRYAIDLLLHDPASPAQKWKFSVLLAGFEMQLFQKRAKGGLTVTVETLTFAGPLAPLLDITRFLSLERNPNAVDGVIGMEAKQLTDAAVASPSVASQSKSSAESELQDEVDRAVTMTLDGQGAIVHDSREDTTLVRPVDPTAEYHRPMDPVEAMVMAYKRKSMASSGTVASAQTVKAAAVLAAAEDDESFIKRLAAETGANINATPVPRGSAMGLKLRSALGLKSQADAEPQTPVSVSITPATGSPAIRPNQPPLPPQLSSRPKVAPSGGANGPASNRAHADSFDGTSGADPSVDEASFTESSGGGDDLDASSSSGVLSRVPSALSVEAQAAYSNAVEAMQLAHENRDKVAELLGPVIGASSGPGPSGLSMVASQRMHSLGGTALVDRDALAVIMEYLTHNEHSLMMAFGVVVTITKAKNLDAVFEAKRELTRAQSALLTTGGSGSPHLSTMAQPHTPDVGTGIGKLGSGASAAPKVPTLSPGEMRVEVRTNGHECIDVELQSDVQGLLADVMALI